MADAGLTDAGHWDEYWHEHVLPAEIARESAGAQARAILDVFDAWLPMGGRTLEVGGSPGQYLAYVHRRTGCDCAILDFSPVGCQLTVENARLLGIPIEVHQADVLDPAPSIGVFDVVYSLGLVEHFDDIDVIVAAHARLTRPGGLLLIGMPNLRGINGWFAQRLGPKRLATHNLDSMRLERWDRFEASLGLTRLFRGPIGGFEPLVFAGVEPGAPRGIRLVSKGLQVVLGSRRHPLRRLNHPAVSGYLMGVWRTALSA